MTGITALDEVLCEHGIDGTLERIERCVMAIAEGLPDGMTRDDYEEVAFHLHEAIKRYRLMGTESE